MTDINAVITYGHATLRSPDHLLILLALIYLRDNRQTPNGWNTLTQKVFRTAGVLILGLSGKLDATTAKAFEDKILAEIEAGDRRLMIDLSQLDYVN